MELIKHIQPPKLALRLFRWYCRPDRSEELEGDLIELYEMRSLSKTSKKWIVDLQFWWDVIRCFKSYSRKSKYFMDTSGALYRSYFKLAWRQMLKNKAPIAINIVGMGLALAFCITVYMIYAYNGEFDDFHKEATETVYRIHALKEDGDDMFRYEATPLPLEAAMKNDFAAVEETTSFLAETATVKYEESYFSEYVAFASPNFLDFFEIPLKSGSKKSFEDPSAIFLTEEIAEKYYGTSSPIGKELVIYLRNNKKLIGTVAGVFERIPLNSSFNFSTLMNRKQYFTVNDVDIDDWGGSYSAGHYLRLSDNQNLHTIEDGIKKYIPIQNKNREEWKLDYFEVVPFKDERVADNLFNKSYINSRVDPKATIVFNIMGFLILFIACFNMANTTMALIAKRVKEIGVRKTLGSFSHQIFTQFLFEMLISMILAFSFALLMADILAEQIWGLFGVSFFLRDISIVNISVFIAVFLLIVTLITGIFPAAYAWKFQPVSILNHKAQLKGVGLMHKILTVGQYSFSIAVLITGVFASRNTDYLMNMDYGYDNKDIVSLSVESNSEFKAIKHQVDQLPLVEYTFGSVGLIGSRTGTVIIQVDTTKSEVMQYTIGADYLKEMDVNISEGRHFIKGSEQDVATNVIVNDEFAKRFLKNNVLDSKIRIGEDRFNIIGVVSGIINGQVYEDYKDNPIIYRAVSENDLTNLVIKTKGDDRQEVEAMLSEIWAKSIDRPFSAKWQGDLSFRGTTGDSQNIKTLFLWLASLGCILSLIGIMSLASLNVAKKTKEITIRKVLGATVSQLILNINRSFVYVLGWALVMGVALGYLISDLIFSMIYRYHLSVNILDGLPLGIAIIGTALLMTSIAVFKPASSNPSIGLRTE